MLGRVVPVLVERRGRHPGQAVGRSPWLQAVHFDAPDAPIGSLVMVRLARLGPNSVAGERADATGAAA
jgi:tRNA-2-methylthio-N6-dimethylallyladenosine synthase